MKRGTVKKAKDTRLLITYSTPTCLYCVIIQKKKHVRHYCTIQSTPNITTKWFYFLQSKTLLNVRKLLGVVISFWSSRVIDLLVIRTPVGYIRQEYE